MHKVFIVLFVVMVLLFMFTVTVCAVDVDIPDAVTDDLTLAPKSLFKAVYSFWSYIFPSEVVNATPVTVLQITMYSVAFLVLFPLGLVLVCLLKLFRGFRGR